MGAEDKGTGKSEKITITADKGRLSPEEIERMLKAAEEFAESDKAAKEVVDAKNALEGFAYNMRNQIEDKEKLGGKISEEDKSTIEDAVKETLEWLDENPEATKDDYADKLKELEGVTNPIVSKLYAAGAGAGAGADFDAEDDIPEGHDDL